EVSRIAIHPNYGVLGQDSDIAMIVLRTALPLGANIQQAPIIGEGIYLPTGLTLNLVGWGTTTEGGLIGDNNLYQLEVLTVSENACLNTYISDSTITENMFCVRRLGADGLDFDSRDCGSPLFYSNTVAGIA
ncbi:trypsin-like serine protease, partial [Escherichia coli]|uniref:trypsin-like serine protease n=1 Tax=Escherichia coli TaxID=562 RepID=UPI00197FC0F5